MADEETKIVVVTQHEEERFHLDHEGRVSLYGDRKQPPMRHDFSGQVVHATAPEHPLVHMVCWDEDQLCKVEVSGRVTLAGDDDSPIQVKMAHSFANDHHQTHSIEPVDHSLKVETQLADPIHHALQLRTPLQVRFCNPWNVVSDYVLELAMGERSLLSLRVTGATVLTPQPCEDEKPCPPTESTLPGNP